MNIHEEHMDSLNGSGWKVSIRSNVWRENSLRSGLCEQSNPY